MVSRWDVLPLATDMTHCSDVILMHVFVTHVEVLQVAVLRVKLGQAGSIQSEPATPHGMENTTIKKKGISRLIF